MRLIKMTGGLGNQMFIYALYLRMKSRYPDTRIDLTDMVHYSVHNGYEMNRVFGLPQTEFCMTQWLKKVAEVLLFRVILERHEHGSLRHYDGPVRWPWVYYKGFYQNLMYFQGYEAEIRRAFTFDMQSASERSRQLALQIDGDPHSVSLHVRRGDYLKAEHFRTVGCVCQLPYYQRAVQEVGNHLASPHYYVFTDDMQWVRENLPLGDAVYVDWNHGEDSWQDMMLMSHCRHHVIPNSTFSWWGAWLGQPGGIVVCPDRWYADDNGNIPLYPAGWTRVKSDVEDINEKETQR